MISTKYLDWKLIPREDPDAGAVRRGVRYAESGPAGRGFPTLVSSHIQKLHLNNLGVILL